MAESLEIKIDSSRIQVKLEEFPRKVSSELRTVSQVLVNELKSTALNDAHRLLQEHTGKYLAGFRSKVVSTSRGVTGIVSNISRVGHFVEYGANRPASTILPNAKQAMHFLAGANEVFAGVVRHPASIMPTFRILHDAFDDMKGEIVGDIKGAVRGETLRIAEG